jgi:hypothetical protein
LQQHQGKGATQPPQATAEQASASTPISASEEGPSDVASSSQDADNSSLDDKVERCTVCLLLVSKLVPLVYVILGLS